MSYNYLNKFFSRKNIIKIIYDEHFDLEQFNRELKNNYLILEKEYRNEFFFKNTLFNKYVLGRYSLNTTSALNEIIIGNSKADFAIFNHRKGIVYEIKTDLDNLERLSYQLEDYYKVFSYVYVVTTENYFYPVYRYIKKNKPSVGIIVLTDRVTLSVRKKAEIDNSNLMHENLFKLLRKSEYEHIIYKKFGAVPDVKPVQYYKVCLNLFKQLDIMEAQEMVFKLLIRRMKLTNIGDIILLPMPIRWLIYSGNFSNKELDLIYKKFK